MERGLKRLWTRRKSKGRDVRQEMGAGSLRRSQSTDLVGLSTNERRRRNTSSDQGAQFLSPTTTNSSSVEPVSSTKKHPMLLGVSRPTTSPSRPGTSGSGSLMSAVNRAAADAGARAEQEYRQSTDHSFRSHRELKAPRFIDIFSLSRANGTNPMPGYNEDVAERNLDLNRVAMESTHSQTPPPSKYAEEVAARNAYPPLRERRSTNTTLSSPGRHFDESAPSGLSRDLSSRVSDYPSGSAGSDNPEWSRFQPLPRSHDMHSRQPSERSWQPRSPMRELPAVAQGPPGPLLAHHVHHVNRSTENLHDRMIAARSAGIPSQLDQNEALRSYKLSATEVMQASRPPTSRPGTAISVAGGARRNDHPLRSQSSMSNTSVKRAINLPHRTIMDLTGTDSDVFSEHAGEPTYSSALPVGQAQIDTTRPTYRSTIENPPSAPESIDLRTNPSLSTEVHTDVPEEFSHNQSPAPSVSEFTVRSTPTKVPTSSELSSISTLASSAPHTSVLIQPKETAGASNFNKQQSLGQEFPVRNEQVDHLLSDSQGRPTSSSHVADRKHITETGKAHEGNHDKAAEGAAVRTIRDERPQADIEVNPNRPREDFANLSHREDLPTSQTYARTPPEIVPPVDFVDPGRSFGVQSRDFASTLPKPGLTSVPEDTESSNDSRAQHAKNTRYRSASHDPNTGRTPLRGRDQPKFSLYQSTFNEDEFAQKQADARAALIRLQESLNENFLTHPTLAARSSRPAAPQHAFSYSDGKPVAPSTIFAQVRNSPPVPAKAKFSADIPTEVDRSERPKPVSYHSLTTLPDPRERQRNGHAVSFDGRKSGKQSNNPGFDGPGPSVLNLEQEVTNPLPLPPPLHINGRRFQHFDRQPVPPSPGEVSLSSFPLPVSSPRPTMSSETTLAESTDPIKSTTGQSRAHSQQSSDGSRVLRRQTSQQSQASSASVFIPYHMVPDRSSSIRDRSVMEGC
ncbi:hypothetical protein RBB50_001892 [Rhinocladiella similis]